MVKEQINPKDEYKKEQRSKILKFFTTNDLRKLAADYVEQRLDLKKLNRSSLEWSLLNSWNDDICSIIVQNVGSRIE